MSRLSRLAALLLLPSDMSHSVWLCFEAVVVGHFSIFAGRHLDQILLCIIYGLAKVRPSAVGDLSFKTIVTKFAYDSYVSAAEV